MWFPSCYFTWCGKAPAIFGTLQWFLLFMDSSLPLIVLQVSWSWEDLATLCSIEWLLSSMIPFMNLHLMWKSSCHIWCTSMDVSFMDPLILLQVSLRSSCHTLCTWMASLQCDSFHESSPGVEKLLRLQWFFPSWTLWWYFKYVFGSWEALATLYAIEWILSSVIPFMLLVLYIQKTAILWYGCLSKACEERALLHTTQIRS